PVSLGAPYPLRHRATLRADIAEGVRWLRGSAVVRLTVLSAAFLNLVRAATLAVLVLYALQDLHAGRFGFALLNTALAAGSVIGSALASRLARFVPERLIVLGGPAVTGLTYLLM